MTPSDFSRVCAVLLAAWALAGALDRAEAAESKDAVVLVHESPVLDGALLASLRELLERRGATLRIGSNDGAPVAVDVVIERLSGQVLVRASSAAAGAANSERNVALGESADLFRETLSHAILGAVEPLLEALAATRPVETPPRGAASVEPRAPASSEAARVPSEERPFAVPLADPRREGVHVHRRHPSAYLQAGWRVGPRWLGDRAPAVSLGGGASVAFAVAFRPAVGVDAAYVWPRTVSVSGVESHYSFVPVRLRGRFEPVSWRWGRLEVSGLLGGDFVSISTAATVPSLLTVPDSRELQPIVGATIGLRTVSGQFELFAVGGLDVDLAPRRWVVTSGDAVEAVLDTGIVRPQLTLGLDLRVAEFGGEPEKEEP